MVNEQLNYFDAFLVQFTHFIFLRYSCFWKRSINFMKRVQNIFTLYCTHTVYMNLQYLFCTSCDCAAIKVIFWFKDYFDSGPQLPVLTKYAKQHIFIYWHFHKKNNIKHCNFFVFSVYTVAPFQPREQKHFLKKMPIFYGIFQGCANRG